MNKGLLSDYLKDKFPDIVAVERPKVEIPINIDPNWMGGFTSGDGCFYVRVSKNSKYNTGFLVELKFKISQHTRDLELLQNFFTFF